MSNHAGANPHGAWASAAPHEGEGGATREIEICAAWRTQRFATPLTTVDGQQVDIVHRGVWSNGIGPDFRDALLVFDGRELRAGSVEIHHRTGGWVAHGHGQDPRYNDVVLHVVRHHDGAETRRLDGMIVPVFVLGPTAAVPVDTRLLAARWDRFGGEACAPSLAATRADLIGDVLRRLGDRRLAGKAARIEARLTDQPPGEVLYREIWDALGYAVNREPMMRIAERLPLVEIEAALARARPTDRRALALALQFGVAGYLPLTAADAAAAGVEPDAASGLDRLWRSYGQPWHQQTIAPTDWTRARVRPANHPAARLAAGSGLLANLRDGLISGLLEPLRAGTDPIITLRDGTTGAHGTSLGTDRCAAVSANVVIPFALALAEHTGDRDLGDAAARAWERLPAPGDNQISRRASRQIAGSVRLGKLGARGQQGLIHLDATLCSSRRCFECPVAALVLAEEGGQPLGSPPVHPALKIVGRDAAIDDEGRTGHPG